MLVIPNTEFDKNFPPAVRMSFKQAAVAYVAEGSTLYGLYDLKEPLGPELKKAAMISRCHHLPPILYSTG